MDTVHQLIVAGGGVAGLDLATHLAGRRTTGGRLQVTLVDQEVAHVWKPMLHTIAAGTREVRQQQTAYLAQAREHGFRFAPGRLAGIDREAKMVRLAPWPDAHGEELLPERAIRYDTLVLALGSRANDFGTPGVAEHGHTIDARHQAMVFNEVVRDGMLRTMVRGRPFDIAIVGGGATGVELAAELIQLVEFSNAYGLASESRMTAAIRVTLVESGPRLLAAFPEAVSEATRQRLEALGVEVRTGTRVAGAERGRLRLAEGDPIEADLLVWAAGVQGSTDLALGDLELTKSRQLVIGPDFRTSRDRDIFALGDCASLTLPDQERPLPPTAQVAAQQARYLARYLPRLIAGDRVPPFTYRDFGALVSLGGYDAFGSLGKFGFLKPAFLRGRVAQLGHAMLYRSHQARLHGFRRGTALWLVDLLNARVRPSIRLD